MAVTKISFSTRWLDCLDSTEMFYDELSVDKEHENSDTPLRGGVT